MSAREALVRNFFDALNRGDGEACAALLAEDCRYVDAQGIELRGVIACANLAAGLKLIDPDFYVDVQSSVRRNDEFLLRGVIHCSDDRFAGETMWRVEMDGNRIARLEATAGRFASVVKAVRKIDPGLDGD